MIYEVVNMSDAITIEADDPKVAMIATLLLGEGAYGLRNSNDGLVMPIMLFGPADRAEKWLAEQGLPDVSAFLDEHIDEVARCLESIVYCSIKDRQATIAVAKATGGDLRVGLAAWNEQKRTSLNDIAGRAVELVKALGAG